MKNICFNVLIIIISLILLLSSLIFLPERSISTEDDPGTQLHVEEDKNSLNEELPTMLTRSGQSRNSFRGIWYDTFDDESKIGSKSNLEIEMGDVQLQTDTFDITTTTDFDAGVKSSSNGNYEVETRTDNSIITSHQLELGSKWADNFNFADSDALTWKWTDTSGTWTPSGSYLKNIDNTVNDKLYLEVGSTSSIGACGINLTDKLTGDFSVQAKHSSIQWTTGSYAQSGLIFYIDAENWFRICITSTASGNWIEAVTRENGVPDTGNFFSTTDRSVNFRLRRSGNTIYSDYDLAQGNSFTNLYSKSSSWLNGNGEVWLILRKTINNGALKTSWDDFRINSGTFVNNGYRTTGNWQSSLQNIPLNTQLKNTTLTFSGLTAGISKIDRIEWLVDGQVKAIYETDIESDTLALFTITESDLTFGNWNDIISQFKIKIYLVGDGTTTPVIENIECATAYKSGTLRSIPITLGTNNVWDQLTITKTEPVATELTVSVLDGGTDLPIDGFSALDGTAINLSSIDPKIYPTIKLEAVLSSESPYTPQLSEWSVSWKPDAPKFISDIPSDWSFPEDTNADNLINLADYFEDIWTSDSNLNFQIIFESDNAHIDATVDGRNLDFTTPTINWSGSETFKVKCTDEGGLSVNSNEFMVTVTEVNDPPAWTPIGYIHISEDTPLVDIIDLDTYIIDCDDILENIYYSRISNNNEDNIFVQIVDRIVYAEPLTKHYVGSAIIKIRAEDGYADADISFTLIIDPVNDKPMVELLSPSNNMIITTNTVKLSWSEGVDVDGTIESYDVYLDDISPPQTLISNDQTVTSFSKDLEDGTYYWTVIPFDGFEEGDMDKNEIWSFSVSTVEDPTTPPPTIDLSSPYDNTIINTESIDLYWNSNASYSNLKYFVYFDTEPKPNKIVATEITDTEYSVINLTDGVTYYWTVIPVSGSLMGSCNDGIWSFKVQLDFVASYEVELTGIDNLVMNQSETLSINLTVTNKGNVKDSFRSELETEKFSNYVGFYNSRNIMLDPDESGQLRVIVTIPEDGSLGYFNVTVTVTSFWGGNTIYDSQKILVKVDPKIEPQVESDPDDKEGNELMVWLLLIVIVIIILIAIAIVAKKRKQKMEATLAEKGIAASGAAGSKVLLPDVVRPGDKYQLGAAGAGAGVRVLTPTPMLKPGIGTTATGAQPQSISSQIARAPSTPQLPGVSQVQVSSTAVQPPRLVTTPPSTQKPAPPTARPDMEMPLNEKLKLLNERLLKGEIDQDLYQKLRREFEIKSRATIPTIQPKLPPASSAPLIPNQSQKSQ